MFSVIIPLYNKEASITNTIRSVLDQTFQDFEIVVINDGSTDRSAKIVSEINDSRIRLMHQENQGVSAARNKGINEAKNDWIAFLDGDDIWKENHLEEHSKLIQYFPENKVFATSFEYSDGRPMPENVDNNETFVVDNYFKRMIGEKLISTVIVVVHKSCIGIVGGFNEKLKWGEDLDLWERLSRKFQIVKSREITAIYRVDAENRSNQSFSLKYSNIYYYKLNLAASEEELIYYKKRIVRKLRYLLRNLHFISFFRLKLKYNNFVSFKDIFIIRKK